MPQLIETEAFAGWLEKLRDRQAQKRIIVRLQRVAAGVFGDVQPVGDGVLELRFHFGPGYRVYFVQRGDEQVFLLGGGDKSSQSKDIAAAKSLWAELKEDQP